MRRWFAAAAMFVITCAVLSGCILISTDPVLTMSVEPTSGYSPLAVHLEAHPAGDDVLSYTWELDSGDVATGREADITLLGTGVVAVRLIATDLQGGQTIIESNVQLHNRPPHARFTVHPSPTPAHHPIVFDARSSSDSDGVIASFHWDFGDGHQATGAHVEHTFDVLSHDCRVTLTVTDNLGASSTMYRDLELIGCDH